MPGPTPFDWKGASVLLENVQFPTFIRKIPHIFISCDSLLSYMTKSLIYMVALSLGRTDFYMDVEILLYILVSFSLVCSEIFSRCVVKDVFPCSREGFYSSRLTF